MKLAKILKAIATNAVIAVAIGGPVSLVFAPNNDCDIPGITDAQHEYCWNKAKAQDEKYRRNAGALMIVIFGGLTWWSYLGRWKD